MSLRAAVEAAIRDRVQAAAPQLVADLWGRMRLTVTFPRIEVKTNGPLAGQAEAWLFAERFDALPVDALIAALRQPIHAPEAGVRLRLFEWREEATDMTVAGRLIFNIDLMEV